MSKRVRGIRIKFWGVRGTCPTPGPKTVVYGGNTPCVELAFGTRKIMLDAGTGLRVAGEKEIGGEGKEWLIFLSHFHWDHIQGFPLFMPLFFKGNKIIVYAEKRPDTNAAEVMRAQMSYPCFPVELPHVAADFEFKNLVDQDKIKLGKAVIKCRRINHPGGCLSYRLDSGSKSVVYATDTESITGEPDPVLIEHARAADCLIYDACYTDQEYIGAIGPRRVGWGHSTWKKGVEVAKAAGVKKLVLFHHDPSHDDGFVEGIEKACREVWPDSLAARDGLEINL
ncbi:MAG: MBL fold metallo-hydrolase [Deltaproteobacteria bacterium]|nr:MBL fold metallo-hydrolase [Deltaproteobacteria bacterium]